MSDFVRYSAELETIAPDIDELLPQVIEFWEKKGGESPTVEGSGRAVRGAHAKSYGLVRAELQILNYIPPAYAQGTYASPRRHGVLMRFSSSSAISAPMRSSANFERSDWAGKSCSRSSRWRHRHRCATRC